jgi:hypothetical protein
MNRAPNTRFDTDPQQRRFAPLSRAGQSQRWGVAVLRHGLSVGASPTRQLSLRPVATGAAVAGNQAAESLWCKGWFSHPANVRALM